mgnify:CR=1 FL=1
MKRTTAKLLCLVLALVMIVSVMAGCAGDTQSSQPEDSKSESSTTDNSSTADDNSGNSDFEPWPTVYHDTPAGLEWQQDTSPITLTMFKNNVVSDDWTWGSDHVTAYITERTGVKLDVEFAPDSEGNRLTILLASGDKLPDLFSGISTTSTHYAEMLDGDYVYAIDELIDEYAPLMREILSPEEIEFSNEEDGHMYIVPTQFFDSEFLTSGYLNINGWVAGRIDLLDELGYGQFGIKTTEQLFEALADFKDIAEQHSEVVYPVFLQQGSFVGGTFDAMFGGASSYSSEPMRYDGKTDSLYFWFDSDRGVEQLKFWNRLYREGYLSKASFTDNDFGDALQAGKFLFAFKNNVWEQSSMNAALAENVPGASVYSIYPLTQSEDKPWVFSQFILNQKIGALISKDCEHPDRAIRFLEYLRSEEGSLAVTSGIYGVDWELATDEQNGLKYTQKIGEAAEIGNDFTALGNIGIYNHQKSWIALSVVYDSIFSYVNFLDPNTKVMSDGWRANSKCVDNSSPMMLPDYISIAPGSEASDLRTNLSDVYTNMLVEIILADSDNQFQSLYDQMMSNLESVGMARYFELVLPLVQEVKGKIEATGVTF